MSINVAMPNLAAHQKVLAQKTASYARDAFQSGQITTTEAQALGQEAVALGKQVFNAARDGNVTAQEQGEILRSQLLLARDVFVAAQPPSTQG